MRYRARLPRWSGPLPNEVASAGLVRTSAASCAGSRAGVDGGRPLDGSATRASSPSPSCRGVDDLAAGSKYGTLGAIRHQIARASNTLTSAAVGVSPTSSYPAAASNAAYSSAVRSRPPGPTSTPTASLAVGRQFTPSGVTGCPVVERAWPGVRSPDFTRHMLNPVRSSSSGRWTKAEPKPGTVGASMRRLALSWAAYTASARRRCRSPKISIRSVSSVRTVSTSRSA